MRALLFLLVWFPRVAHAHPGHSTIPADRPAHYLATPEHLGGALLAVIGVGVLYALFRRPSRTD
jgi:hypothetical protein